MRFFALFFFSIFIFHYSAQTWLQTSSFPGTPRDDGTHFKIGTKHYVGTGREVGFGCTRDFFSFDETTLSWSTTASLPFGKERQYASTVSWNGKGYLFGGVDCAGNFKNDFWCFDPISDSWSALNQLPAAGRGGVVHFILQDTLYLIGGRNDSGILNEVWCYSFFNQTWTQKNALPFDGIWRGIAYTFQNTGYIGLGKNNANNQTGFNAAVWTYESSSDSWTIVPNLSLGERTYVGYAQTDSSLFLFGGQTPSNQLLATFERIDLSDNTIDVLTDFSGIPRKGGCVFLVQHDFYYTTGVSTDTRFNETWRLTNVVGNSDPKMEEFIIYPNPASATFCIKSNELIESLVITNSFGQVIRELNCNGTTVEIETNEIQSGSYLLTIKTVKHVKMEKLFIVR
jgi:hypothetical protein